MIDYPWLEHPFWTSVLWVGAQLTCALVGYYQGRRAEELRWRRVVGILDKRVGGGKHPNCDT
jgi:hypothetical protein